MRKDSPWLRTALAAGLCLAALPGTAGELRLGDGVLAALAGEPSVRVLVSFEVPMPAGFDRGRFLTSAAGRRDLAAARQRLLAALPAEEVAVERRFETVDAFAATVTRSGLEALLAAPGVRRIDLDAPGRGTLAESVPLSNFDTVHAAGFTGTGTAVAVLDTGYDSDHPDLSDDLLAERCFCSGGGGCCPNGMTSQSGAGSAEDDHGHGTNVSGIVTSAGSVAPVGAAPDAGVVAVKVMDSNNSFCCTSDVVAGLDWVAVNHPDVEAVNMSLGTFALFAGECDAATSFTMAFATAVDNLRSLGIPVFASSGNDGSGTEMPAPACVRNAISVGAVYDANIGSSNVFCSDPVTAPDLVTCFSNSNSTTDLFAPGARLTSAGIGGGTSSFFGTSQASPHAAACAALLAGATPGLAPATIENAMEASPVMVTDSTNGLSFPRLDCADALARTAAEIFSDGFESGDTSSWSATNP